MNKVLLLCPIPPPYAGPEVASEILMNNLPRKLIDYEYLKSNLRDENWKKGKFDFSGLYRLSFIVFKLIKKLFKTDTKKVYLLLSSCRIGFLRDSIYIILSLLFGKKIILHYRGGNFDGFYDKCNWFFKKYIGFVLNKSNVIIVQAEILKKMFEPITKGNIKVLYNGLCVTDNFVEKKFDSKETTLLFIGHIAFSKGFYELISVYKRIYKSLKLRLIFAGTFRFEGKKSKTQVGFLNMEVLKYYVSNSERISNEIKEFAENAEKYNAKYLGIISGKEKENVFNNSDILILPSYTEGFSVTVLEALSEGLPVIVSNVGALPEIIKENENGWIVEAGSESSIEKKLKLALSNKYRFTEISKNNRVFFEEKFNIQKISSEFEKILYEA
jgi:glycosyltransferase involved in cell wall biosynthesis